MAFHWINPEDYSFQSLLLMDRWILRYLFGLGPSGPGYYEEAAYKKHLGIALAHNPAVLWYITQRCPEAAGRAEALAREAPETSPDEVRQSELYVVDALDSFIVYVYPESMESLDYIRLWEPKKLLSMTDFRDKLVLDIGSGTGRLAFAAASQARWVYASEPVDRLREYLREKQKRLNVPNISVLDGTIEEIPYPDDTFDIVMSGHVVGDDYDREYNEMCRVVRPGGMILTCIGEDDWKREPDKDMLRLGFEALYHTSVLGGDIYRYRKHIEK